MAAVSAALWPRRPGLPVRIQIRQFTQTSGRQLVHGERRPGHQWQPIFHYPRRYRLAQWKHTVFGQVRQGQEVVDAVRQGDELISVVISEQ